MIKVSMVYDGVKKELEKRLDLARDMSPILLQIRGQSRDRDPLTVIGGINAAFAAQQLGRFKWADLSDRYAKWKQKHYGNNPMLVRTGYLIKSVINEGAPGNVSPQIARNRLIWGTTTPYAIFHQSSGGPKGGGYGAKRGVPFRPFMGISGKQKKNWKELISYYLVFADQANRRAKGT